MVLVEGGNKSSASGIVSAVNYLMDFRKADLSIA